MTSYTFISFHYILTCITQNPDEKAVISPQGLFGWSFRSHDKILSLIWRQLTGVRLWHHPPWCRRISHLGVPLPSQALIHISDLLSSGRYHRLVGIVSREVTHPAHTHTHTHTGATFRWEADVLITCSALKSCMCWLLLGHCCHFQKKQHTADCSPETSSSEQFICPTLS